MNAEEKILGILDFIEGVTPDAIMYGLQPAYALSQELVPVHTGKLKASGFLEVIGSGSKKQVVIGYAKGNNPYYGLFVHEMTDIYHSHGTQAKFLSDAIDITEGKIEERIEYAMRKALRVAAKRAAATKKAPPRRTETGARIRSLENPTRQDIDDIIARIERNS